MFYKSIFLYCIAVSGLLYGCSLYECENKILHEQYLGGTGYKLLVMEVGCGATTQTSIHVSIIESSKSFDEEMRGNVFVTNDQKFNYVEDILWDSLNGRVTLVERDTLKTFKKSFQVDFINIEYINNFSLYKLPNRIEVKVDSLFKIWNEMTSSPDKSNCKLAYLIIPDIIDGDPIFKINFGHSCPGNFFTSHAFKYLKDSDEFYVYSSTRDLYVKINLNNEFKKNDDKYSFENLNSFLRGIQVGDFYATSGHYTGDEKYIASSDLNIGTYYATDLDDYKIGYSINVGFKNSFDTWRVDQLDQLVLGVTLKYSGIKLWNDLEVGLSISEFDNLDLIKLDNNTYKLIEVIDFLSNKYRECIVTVDSSMRITRIEVNRK